MATSALSLEHIDAYYGDSHVLADVSFELGEARMLGLLGPIVGAGLVVVVKNVVSAFIERWNFLLGAVFVAIVILMPEGLVPGTVRLWRWGWRGRRLRRNAARAAKVGEAS